jgi:hypothetical protein
MDKEAKKLAIKTFNEEWGKMFNNLKLYQPMIIKDKKYDILIIKIKENHND